MESLLIIRGLTIKIPGNPARTLLDGADADVAPSARIAVVGPSGQGKSTLLRTLALLAPADAGRLFLEGRPSADWEPREWRSAVCYVAQSPVMLSGTVEDNLRTVSAIHRRPFEQSLADRLMEELGLGAVVRSRSAAELSGGEKQRLSLIRSLLLRPKLLLLDEVTSSLDEASKLAVERLLQEWNRTEGAGYIWITHEPEQALRAADIIWHMSDGVLAASGRENAVCP